MLLYNEAITMTGLKQDFKEWQKEHPNFITPNVHKVVAINSFIVEISKGDKMDGTKMYGVGLWRPSSNGFEAVDYELNRAFDSLEGAREHADMLKDKAKEL